MYILKYTMAADRSNIYVQCCINICYNSYNTRQLLEYSASKQLEIVRYVGMQSAFTYHLIL